MGKNKSVQVFTLGKAHGLHPLPYTNPHGFAPILSFGYMENVSRVATPSVILDIVRL